jgi:PAS domain-containing protein
MDEIQHSSNGPRLDQPSGPAASLTRAHASERLDQGTDVERERLSRELDESRHLFQRMADLIPDALTVYDMNIGQLVFVNQRTEQITGYTPDVVGKLGHRFATTLWHPETGSVLKKTAEDQLISAIRAVVAAGGLFVDPTLTPEGH